MGDSLKPKGMSYKWILRLVRQHQTWHNYHHKVLGANYPPNWHEGYASALEAVLEFLTTGSFDNNP